MTRCDVAWCCIVRCGVLLCGCVVVLCVVVGVVWRGIVEDGARRLKSCREFNHNVSTDLFPRFSYVPIFASRLKLILLFRHNRTVSET